MMGYVYLIIALAFGGLYLDDKHQRSQVTDLEGQVVSAKQATTNLEQSLRNEEQHRADEIANLQQKQAVATTALIASWRGKVAALSGTYNARLAQMEGTLHAYITPVADSRCVLPVGAVLFHDAAARGAPFQSGADLSRTAGGSVDANSGIRLSDAFGTVGWNYAGAQAALSAAIAEVTAWRNWYVAQRALFK